MEQHEGDKEMEGATVVVDASVAVKWFVEEEYSDKARLLMEAYAQGVIDIAAPSILPYEVLNALKYSGAFGEDELKEAAQILDDLQLTLYGLEGDLGWITVEIAMRKGITIYDASYVALATLLEAPLYTADEKLIEKTRGINLVKHITTYHT